MTQPLPEDDEKLGALLREAVGVGAPPERDPMFRLGVIERRERQRYQRRSLILAIAAIAVAIVFAIGFNAGANLLVTSAIALLFAALAAAIVLSVPGVRELLRRLQRAAGKDA